MSNATPRSATAAAKTLRLRLNALALDLARFTAPDEIRSCKLAIRAAELELTALADAEIVEALLKGTEPTFSAERDQRVSS